MELTADSDEARTLLQLLRANVPQISVVAATATRVVTFEVAYFDDDFVMVGGLVHSNEIICVRGPAGELPGQLSTLLEALGEAASVPLSPLFGERPVPVPDALVLAEDVRVGAADDLVAALRVAEFDAVPPWLSGLADGITATFLVLVTDTRGTRTGMHLVGLPGGWGHLDEVNGGLSMMPMDLDDVLAELDEIGLLAASLVGDF